MKPDVYKRQLLYLLRILQKETDEEHYLNSQQLIERLEKYDISAERKSIYDDIARLTDFGYDIIHVKTKGGSLSLIHICIFAATCIKWQIPTIL